MKKWRQKSGCPASFGNAEIKKIAAANRAPPLPQITLRRYWKSYFMLVCMAGLMLLCMAGLEIVCMASLMIMFVRMAGFTQVVYVTGLILVCMADLILFTFFCSSGGDNAQLGGDGDCRVAAPSPAIHGTPRACFAVTQQRSQCELG
jgi:hypothetical protein